MVIAPRLVLAGAMVNFVSFFFARAFLLCWQWLLFNPCKLSSPSLQPRTSPENVVLDSDEEEDGLADQTPLELKW